MTTKKPATLLALAGTAALVVAGPATLASPPTGADSQPDAGATASLMEARAAARSAPSSSWTTMLTTEAGSTSSVDWA